MPQSDGNLRQYSSLNGNCQMVSALTPNFGGRLREERVRCEPHQGKFAQKIGVRQGLLSDWEKGANIKLEDLARLADAGIDVLYVITGRRSGSLLPEIESRVLDSLSTLDAVGRMALLVTAERMAGRPVDPSIVIAPANIAGATLQEPGQDYRPMKPD